MISEPHSLQKPNYRPDIDGLRAVAVSAVVVYHAFPSLCPGGFIGVDVFFVISGFLITSIILSAIRDDQFSFLVFYGRRIRRIFPALIVVLATSLLVGRFVLLPSAYRELALETVAGAAFLANFLFWQQAGYFDTAADLKPLLHLWSLGVEEQFYLVWPLILFLCCRVRGWPLAIIGAILIVSFSLNVFVSTTDATEAFYLPHTRFWELMIGALLAYLKLNFSQPTQIKIDWYGSRDWTKSIAGVCSWAGFSLVIAGFWLIHRGVVFPGWWALLPTVGTGLIIAAGPSAWLNRRVLSHPVAVFIGLISFPLYLWHWPALFFLRAIESNPSAASSTAVLVISFVLAALTYLLIELPIRRSKHGRRGWVGAFAGIGAAVIGGSTVSAFPYLVALRTDEAKLMRVLGTKESIAFAEMYGAKPCFRSKIPQTAEMFVENGCLVEQFPGRPTVFLIGDSHSASLSIGLRPLLADSHINFLQVSSGSCEPTFDEADSGKYAAKMSNDPAKIPTDALIATICNSINAMVLAKIEEIKPDILIVDSHWIAAAAPQFFTKGGDYIEALKRFLTGLKARGAKKIVVVGQMPTYVPSLPEVLIVNYLRKGLLIPTRVRDAQANSLEMDSKLRAAKYPEGVTYLSLRDILCNDEGCLTTVGADLERDLLLWDYGHLTVAGSSFVATGALMPLLTDLLRRER